MDLALSDDSECAAGEAGPSCSLNALQVKGSMLTEEEADVEERLQGCCSRCNGGFCAPESGHCHHHKSKPYYRSCSAHTAKGIHSASQPVQSWGRLPTVQSGVPQDPVLACCDSCPGGFCSPGSGHCYHSKVKPYYKSCSSITHQASMGCSIHEERIADLWETCHSKENRKCKSCGIYAAMHTPGKHGGGCPGVVYVGEKVVPRKPCSGGEGITASTAGEFDKVWSCAVKKTHESPSMAHIMNPWRARTQHHLHIIVKPLDSRGMHLAEKLEKVTGCMPGQWHKAHWACHYSWAQLYNSLPPVFNEVYELAATGNMGTLVTNPSGEPTLASVGISVLYICGGKPVVLATGDGHGGCSVEHAMTR